MTYRAFVVTNIRRRRTVVTANNAAQARHEASTRLTYRPTEFILYTDLELPNCPNCNADQRPGAATICPSCGHDYSNLVYLPVG
jgi:hypothetical protein